MRGEAKVYWVLLIGVLGISFSAIIIRSISAPPNVIALYRMLFTTLFFVPAVFIRCREELKALSIKEYLFTFASGFFLALHFVTWITSLFYTTVAASTVLVSMQPIFTAFMALILLKEKLSKKEMLGMLIAISGSCLIAVEGYKMGSGSFYGNILALTGGLMAALYIIIGRGMRKKMSLVTYGFLVYGSCSLTLLMINLITRTPLTTNTSKDYLYFLALAVICTIGGHTIFNWGLKYVEASKISTFMLGEPVGATIWAMILLKEYPSIMESLGGGIIISGLVLFTIKYAYKTKITDSNSSL